MTTTIESDIRSLCKLYDDAHVYSRLILWKLHNDGSFEIQLASPYGRSYYTYYDFKSVPDFRRWVEMFGVNCGKCGL